MADRSELARVLKRARERLQPADVGVPAGYRRRVPGLRREEVAHLAGVSVDYVVRLEQGRGPHPSRSVLAALARALRLDNDERDELFNLAGTPPPPPGRIDDVVRPSVLRLIDRFEDLPTMVLSAKGDMLAWNPIAAALLGDWSRFPLHQRNINWQRFLGTGGRVAMTEDEREATAAQSVASLRGAAARYPDDPGLAELITELREESPDFVRLWDAGSAKPWRNHRKTVVHPSVGPITLDCESLHVPDADQMVVVYSAEPGTPDADALALLRVVGTQDMAPQRLR